MDNPREKWTRSPLSVLLASLLCLAVVGCQGKDPTPKAGSTDRPLSLPKERKAVNATAARPVPRAPERGTPGPYRTWQPEGLADGAPLAAYREQFPVDTYRGYEPVARSGRTQYQGYRFRPTEPVQSPRSPNSAGGDWDGSGSDTGGYGTESRERWLGYDGGYAQRGQRFRPPGERERERWQPEERSPYGWSPYGNWQYPPFVERDVYGFELGR